MELGIYVNCLRLGIYKFGIHVNRHELNICRFGMNWAYVKLICNLELGHMLIM